MNSKTIPGVLAFSLVLGVSNISTYFIQQSKIDKQAKSLSRWEESYQTKSGWTMGFGGYNLLTMDEGRTWWNVKHDENWMTLDIQRANPDLLAQIKATDDLIAYVKAHKTITFDDKVGMELLKSSGFTIKQP